jgi:serine phosphatase RsbU (regulator of sigma subunit)/pSer/pThr/pTyr-binding forkhead associated (FHA) protein
MSHPQSIVPTLELIRDGRVDRVFEVKGADLHIGRSSGSDVHFDESKVSRNHARVERRPDGSCYLVDLDSQNRTYVDDRKLTPFQPVRLQDGSRIKVVDIELIFRDPTVRVRKRHEEHSTVLGSIDDLSSQRLAQRLQHPAEAFKAILDVNRALGSGSDLNEVLGRVLDGLMAVCPRAERGFILTVEPDGTLPLRASRPGTGAGVPPSLSRTIARQVLRRAKAVLISDVTMDPEYKDHPSVAFSLRTALAVPLPGNDGRPVGMAQLDSRGGDDSFTAADLDLLAALAVPIGVAVENHRLLRKQASWAAAGEIQLALLPRDRPEIPGYTFWECYRPALEVGGDLYDYIPIGSAAADEPRPGRWAVTVGDVAGKGMPAALMMAGIRPEIRHLVRAAVAPQEVLTRVNRHVFDSAVDARFITLVLAEIDPGSHRLTVANAGHPAPLIRRSAGAIEAVGEGESGLPLGVSPSGAYRATTVALEAGDVVVFYSDGGPDALDRQGERFGDDRFQRALAEAPPGAAAVGEAILAALRDFAAGRSQFDDITLVCFGPDAG